MQLAIDRFGQTELARHKLHRPHAAAGNAPGTVRDFIVNVRGGEHRPFATGVIVLVQPPQNTTLASCQSFLYLGMHSKTLRACVVG